MINPKLYFDFTEGKIIKATESDVQTTNATVTTLATITPLVNSVGFLEVALVATASDGSKSITGKKFVHWRVAGASASVITATNDAADSLNGLTTATWTVDASGATLRIRVTGEAATTLNWYVYYHLQSITTAAA